MRIVPAVFLVALCAAAPAAAASPVNAEDDGERMICKNQAKTGTRFAKRICRTQSHWEQMREVARRQAEQEFNKPIIETRRE